MTPAGKLQRYLRKQVEASGGCYRKVRWEGRRGCPDCFVWWRDQHAWIEIKAGEDRFSDLQEREIGKMRDAGLQVFTARNEDDIDRILKVVRGGVDNT